LAGIASRAARRLGLVVALVERRESALVPLAVQASGHPLAARDDATLELSRRVGVERIVDHERTTKRLDGARRAIERATTVPHVVVKATIHATA
jgi:hypothetical protein